jgi:hypothetical protein
MLVSSSCPVFVIELNSVRNLKPVTVAEPSKACTVSSRSEVGIVSSNPTQGMDVWYVYACILFMLPCVSVEALRRADHSSKESYRLWNWSKWEKLNLDTVKYKKHGLSK